MRGAVKVLTLFGISVEIHVTFIILPLIFFVLFGLKGLVLILFVFLCVTIHEFTHSLVARRFGGEITTIVLFPIGGMAMMKKLPEKPMHEFITSIVGPLSNVIIAFILYFPLVRILGPETLKFPPSLADWPHTIAYMFWVNIILAIFNLLPAFPLDGGRVFRAFLAQYVPYRTATRIAVAVGHTIALFLGFLGIISRPPNFLLIIIAVFIYFAASQEETEVDIRITLGKYKIKDILPDEYKTVEPNFTLTKVLEITFHSHQEDFPVIENKKLVGLLTRSDLVKAIHQYGMDQTVGGIMRKEYPTIDVNDPVRNAQKVMMEFGVRALPVLKKGKLCGLITIEDLSKVYSLMTERHG